MRVIVHTEPHAEDNAALQAWYSRSSKSVIEHREKLAREGSGRFMDQIFIQYGHASVGDLGHATVYFEGISMLAAKALQDNQLYNGQECSSRYIDFGSADFLTGSQYLGCEPQVADLLERMRSFYVNSLPKVEAFVAQQFPREEGQAETTYAKAVKARAFDILRGFLPCGAVTNVAWTGTLRNLSERLELLMHHPLREIRVMSAMAYKELFDKYPHSFRKEYARIYDAEAYGGGIEAALLAMEDEEVHQFLSQTTHFYSDILVTSPEHAENMDILGPHDLLLTGLPTLSRAVLQAITTHPRRHRPTRHGGSQQYRMVVESVLDFGSFRDLQRHRGGYCSMPAVDPLEGFHYWYFTELPIEVSKEASELLDDVKALDHQLITANPTQQQRLDNQYFMPMGCLVPFTLVYSVSQALYVAELRSGQTVHPTLRPLAQSMASYLEDHGAVVHYDDRPDVWTVRRGNQDIVEKTAEAAQE